MGVFRKKGVPFFFNLGERQPEFLLCSARDYKS